MDSDLRRSRVGSLEDTLWKQTMLLSAYKPDTPAAIRTDLGAIFISLELSKSTWLITALAPGSEKMSRHSVAGGDLAGMFACFSELRRKTQVRQSQL